MVLKSNTILSHCILLLELKCNVKTYYIVLQRAISHFTALDCLVSN